MSADPHDTLATPGAPGAGTGACGTAPAGEAAEAADAALAAPVLEQLRAALGQSAVVVDAAERTYFGHDVFGSLEVPIAVVRPTSVAALATVVRLAAATRTPLTVRGGGASYTHGYVPARPGSLLLDTGALTGVAIDAARRTVTVEPGVTWAALDAALAPHGLRVPFWGPYSGLVATVGGSVSQHAVSMGSGLYETSATPVVALEVIDGRGRTIRTNRPEQPFLRAYGPDLTGLFLGDCGTLGVKARIVLKTIARPTHVGACSFAYPDFGALLATLDAVAARQLACEILALDPEILKGFMGSLTPRRFLATARAIVSTTPNAVAAATALVRAGLGMRRYLGAQHYMAHFTVEGWSVAEVQAKVASIRALAAPRGAELANAAPLALRGKPFLPLAPILAPDGFRWLPTHGIFAFADVPAFHAAFERWRAAREPEFREHRLRITRMFMPLGSTATVYEPTFYWPDARHVAHERLAPEEHLARIPSLPPDEPARATVFRLRRELTQLMAEHGAQHLQLGKWYPYRSRQHEGARALLDELKRSLDPDGLLNPGALEFD